MPITLREFAPADAEGVAQARRAAVPFMVVTAETLLWELRTAPPEQRYRLLVAETADGRIAGSVRMGLYLDDDSRPDGRAFASPYADPRLDGPTAEAAGSALLGAAEEYLAAAGAGSVYIWANDDGHSPARAEAHGYRRLRRAGFLRLDLAATALPPAPEPPRGVELRPLADFADDPRPIHALDTACAADEPADVPVVVPPYEEWLARDWQRPGLDLDLSTVAVADGVPAAFTLVQSDGHGRLMSAMTGTLRAHRGRGLAKLIKSHALRRAKAAGCTEAFTGNDAGNEPMLAVNEWLGYAWSAAEWRYVREL
ncbi:MULTISPECIES: GNAT family N-acetyltransferase [Streptomyces]|uniref:GNAT family N-acetyltransferase n=1 Tax=Streptomyces TaxID=1883 RepID=UPI00163CF1F2|nr:MULTISPECIES: GNAT family N-acetyltransferase [Streptomyces]MBC2878147.1 GNAT family N-acetyltransferase [Streptomyces sp. TYQ1024]UBI39648.1 GNAT family N-acetyltransferase [Streptomyces mobaraensis]UKW32225.1 GNAT family N-acetyltransferase [Streptomyces sp. TYQ1024]